MNPPNSSTFVAETVERESSWLRPALEREGAPEEEVDHCLATAVLVRGVMNAIPVPAQAETESCEVAVGEMKDQLLGRGDEPVQAPWYLKVGQRMRHVFTLNKKR